MEEGGGAGSRAAVQPACWGGDPAGIREGVGWRRQRDGGEGQSRRVGRASVMVVEADHPQVLAASGGVLAPDLAHFLQSGPVRR